MRMTALGLCVLLAAAVGSGAEQLMDVDWADLAAAGRLPRGVKLTEGADSPSAAVEFVHHESGPVTVGLIAVDRPAVTALKWAMEGTVRYRNVAGIAYLEMWSSFEGGGRYFSRTLARSGPMAALTGTSGWRPFSLPFDSEAGIGAPTGVELNLVMSGAGSVIIGPVRLVQYGAGEDPLAAEGAWWGDRQGGLIGGIAGGTLGVLGAVVGVLAGLGRGRRVATAVVLVMVGCGAVGIVVTVVAVATRQPFGVWYPIGLLGVLATAIGIMMRRRIERRYEEVEVRRMRAIDLGVP